MAYSNVALSPDGGASWSLAHTLPRPLATELLMCGDKITAERLHAAGPGQPPEQLQAMLWAQRCNWQSA
jgi:hypothetical protein